jgi:hypothetical protein
MTTRGPAGRVRALLEVVRPVVDEIVVAVDRDGDRETLGACSDLVDRGLVYEFELPAARLIGWIHHQCACDWIIRLDDDEVPGASLLDALPALTAERSLTHFHVPRRWLYPAPNRYILRAPWVPDYQNRIVRNIPGLWRFAGTLHRGIEVLGEGRFLEMPIYHGDCVLRDIATRRAKREAYDGVGAISQVDGRRLAVPVNDMFVPEEREPLPTTPVPPADADLVGRVLDALPPPPLQARAPVSPRVVSLSEIDRYNSNRTVHDKAYRARVDLALPPGDLPAGTLSYHDVLVENLGSEDFPAGPTPIPPVHVSYRWIDAAGREPASSRRLPSGFPETVPPGASTRVLLAVLAPPLPGDYLLEVDVIHDDVRWFGSPAQARVRIVASATGVAAVRRRGGTDDRAH